MSSLPAVRLPNDARGWHVHADALASFFLELTVRRDVWGAYLPLEHRDPEKPSTYTAPAKNKRGRVTLDHTIAARHFRGASHGHVIGAHLTSPAGWSRCCGLDFDAHGDVTETTRAQLRDAVSFCTDALGDRWSLLLEDSNGAGGFHLWAHFADTVPTTGLFVLLQSIALQCAVATGIRPESYPKQASVPPGGYGSWLRWPGLHHTRPHWSRVTRPGAAWARGADAAQTILHDWPASPAASVPPLDAYPSTVAVAVAPSERATAPLQAPLGRARRIEAYVASCPHGGAGTGRSDVAYSLACFLRFEMACTDGEALPVLVAWDAGNHPPLGHAKLTATWQNSGLYGGRRAA